ncbi:MAG: biopolymer transporter ExbD [Armatimonadota bacterium]|nr:biopolymer transporter ExbD [Armatimonadota bacterium]
MAMSTGSGGGRMMAEINITPFTDVCLVLLIIFMVSASFLGAPRDQAIKLPIAKDKATNPLPDRDLTLTIDKNDDIYLEIKKENLLSLATDLRDYSHQQKIRNVIIKADKSVLYDQIVKVMSVITGAGVTYMSLAVQQDQPPSKPAAS